jgi:AraC-like DNA-binding protein
MKPSTYGGGWFGLGKDLNFAALFALHLVRFYAGRHRYQHPAWVVDYVLNTAGRFRVGSRSRPWRARLPRTLHLYPPNTVYWEDYPRGGKTLCEFAFVVLRGGEAAGLDKLVHPRAGYARFLDPEGLAGPLLEEIARIGQEHGEGGFWQAQAVLCRLIDLLRKSEPTEDETRLIGHPAPAAPPHPLVQAADEYLSAHLDETVLLADVARHLHISVSTLSHRYHAETGETPMTRLLRLRIDRAKSLLLCGQKLNAIVEVTGFSDIAHFSRTFKRFEGVSPQEYLRALRSPEPPPNEKRP